MMIIIIIIPKVSIARSFKSIKLNKQSCDKRQQVYYYTLHLHQPQKVTGWLATPFILCCYKMSC